MARARLESLLTQFPRLLQAEQQHTYVETDEVRFIYQPLDVFFLVLVTNKASNLLLDMETLKTLARIVPEHCPVGDEDELQLCAYELLLAFDEIVSLGYREKVSAAQLHTILAMESHEEMVQEIIAKNKMQEAKEAAKLKIKQIEMQKREAARKSSLKNTPSPAPLHVERSEPDTFIQPRQPPLQKTGKGMKLGRKSGF